MADQIGNSKPVYPEWLENFRIYGDAEGGANAYCMMTAPYYDCGWCADPSDTNLRQIYAAVRDHWRSEHRSSE